jgi:proteasome lid subunit RPN8/RPN11
VGTKRLALPSSVLGAIVQHAREAVPLEAVGLLGGTREGDVKRHVPLPNLLGPRRFLVDPYAQYRALRQLEEERLVPVAAYHSHPGGGVDLSASDIAFARSLPYLQVVIALNGSAVRIAAWAVAETGLRSVDIAVVDDGGPTSFTGVASSGSPASPA